MKGTQGFEIYKELKEDIVFLKLKPGQQLNIKELVNIYGVSRSPVRDAFIKLSNERLVEIIPQSGCKVTKINIDMAEQERFIRKSIELEMIKRKTLVVDKEFLINQKSNLMFQKSALEDNNLEAFFKLDEEFHQRFFENSGLLYTWKIVENNTCSSYKRVRMLSTRVSGIANNIYTQHENLITAAEEKDFSKLFMIAKNHLTKIEEEIPFLKEKYPSYFSL